MINAFIITEETGEIMTHFVGQDFFLPYDSDQEIFCEKIPPELGRVPSKWQMDVPVWRLFHAENRDMVPYGFFDREFDDSFWKVIQVPSVLQTEGFGMASDLQYDAASRDHQSPFSKRIAARFSTMAASELDDDIGVYRTWVDLPASYMERAVYFSCSGIRGRFEIYVNGQPVEASPAIYSSCRFFISPFLIPGHNQLTILVYRLDGKKHKLIRKENGTFGMSGIFRMPEIIAEPLLEIASANLTSNWVNTKSEIQASEETTDDSHISDDPSIITELTSVSSGASFQERRDARVRFRVTIKNHSDLLRPVFVSASLLEAHTEYDLYDLPVHKSSVFALKGNASPNSELEMETEFIAKHVLPWSDQHPLLYDLLLYLFDAREHLICVKRIRFGFRTTTTIGRVFHLNDIALPIRAVRYFSFDPSGGLAVSRENMLRDILFMKQAGINTVICAHIPHDPLFYSMCDHYGLLVISQAERNQVMQMIVSLCSHPSIIMWSFSPFTYDERKLSEAKKQLLLIDPSRPFYCETDKSKGISDMLPFPNEAGKLFGEWTDLCLYKKPIQQKAGMGVNIFGSIKGRAPRKEDLEDYLWIHQGDLEEFHEKYDVSIAQGIMSSDRKPHPIYFEIKKQCETIQFIPDPDNGDLLTIANIHPIGQTFDLRLHWDLLLGGIRIKGGEGSLLSIPPLGQRRIRLPIDVKQFMKENWMCEDLVWEDAYRRAFSKELVLRIRLTLNENRSFAADGHELAFYQQVLLDKTGERSNDLFPVKKDIKALSQQLKSVVKMSAKDGFQIQTVPEGIVAGTRFLSASFSRDEGSLTSIKGLGGSFLTDVCIPSFYRAATNADRSDQAFALAATIYSRETDWRDIQKKIRFKKFFYEMEDDDFSFIIQYRSAACKGDVLMQYLLSTDGKLRVTLSFTPKYDLLRCGIRFSVPSSFNRLVWYGRGSGETYSDRKESGKFGIYSASPDELYHEYARPQENGGHCDTGYLLYMDENRRGMRITSGDLSGFSFTASFFEPGDMDDHMHQEELKRQENLILFLDFYQRGIERTGKETKLFVKNRPYRGTFVFEPCLLDDPIETSDH
jgi:beta-galactosidase/beta-glucuronidase